LTGTLSAWGKKVGDKCSPGETVADIMTDKALMYFEAQDEFYIAKFLVEVGDEVEVGAPIMVTVEDESSVAAFADYVLIAGAAPVVAEKAVEAKSTPPPAVAPVVAPKAAPVVSAPVVVPVSIAPPVIAIQSPQVVTQATVPSQTSAYSVKWSSGVVSKSAIAGKLAKDQQAYILKYGRSGQRAL
jgi:pyruvate dehydrogenase E2 component (dihydrolipoamide acetyltransferase)